MTIHTILTCGSSSNLILYERIKVSEEFNFSWSTSQWAILLAKSKAPLPRFCVWQDLWNLLKCFGYILLILDSIWLLAKNGEEKTKSDNWDTVAVANWRMLCIWADKQTSSGVTWLDKRVIWAEPLIQMELTSFCCPCCKYSIQLHVYPLQRMQLLRCPSVFSTYSLWPNCFQAHLLFVTCNESGDCLIYSIDVKNHFLSNFKQRYDVFWECQCLYNILWEKVTFLLIMSINIGTSSLVNLEYFALFWPICVVA